MYNGRNWNWCDLFLSHTLAASGRPINSMSDEWWAYELHMWIHLPCMRVRVLCDEMMMPQPATATSSHISIDCKSSDLPVNQRQRVKETGRQLVYSGNEKKASIWILVITAHHLAASPTRKVNELKIGNFCFLFFFIIIFLSPFRYFETFFSRNWMSSLRRKIRRQHKFNNTRARRTAIRDHMIMESKPAKWINLSLSLFLFRHPLWIPLARPLTAIPFANQMR